MRALLIPAPALRRLATLIAGAAGLSLLLACSAGAPAAPEHIPMPTPVNRIAYIDSEGQLQTVRPDGSHRNALTPGAVAGAGDNAGQDARSGAGSEGRVAGILAQPAARNRYYSWPTWSPDGSRIAVSLIAGAAAGDAEISVQSLEAATGVGGPVFVNDLPLTIADGAPHYVQWSPDGRRLGITAATPEGLTLFIVDANPADGDVMPPAPLAVQRGAPLYFDWSPDSKSLAVHNGEAVLALRLNDDFTQFETQPVSRSASFRTPAWSPDGVSLAWSAPGGDGEAIWLGRPADPDYPPLRLAEVEGMCAFAWSSDGRVIAVADRQVDNSPAYRRLRLLAADGSAQRTIREDDWVLGFFWEPNGSRLAWIALNTEERTMEWRLAGSDLAGAGAPPPSGPGADDDNDDNDDNALGGLSFSPSGETFLLLAFFDQYARSHSPWAPDGSALAVAGAQQYLSRRRNGSGGDTTRIYVAETGAGGALRDIAGGSIAVWSTR